MTNAEHIFPSPLGSTSSVPGATPDERPQLRMLDGTDDLPAAARTTKASKSRSGITYLVTEAATQELADALIATLDLDDIGADETSADDPGNAGNGHEPTPEVDTSSTVSVLEWASARFVDEDFDEFDAMLDESFTEKDHW